MRFNLYADRRSSASGMPGLTKQNKRDLSAESFLAHWREADLRQL